MGIVPDRREHEVKTKDNGSPTSVQELKSHEEELQRSTSMPPSPTLAYYQSCYETFAKETIAEVLRYEHGDGEKIVWTFISKKSDKEKGEELYKGTIQGSSWNAVKVVLPMNASPQTIAQLLNDVDKMTQFDDMVDKSRIIQDLSKDGTVTVRQVFAKPIFPTTAREFLVITSLQEIPLSTTEIEAETKENTTIKETCSSSSNIVVVASRSVKLDTYPETPSYVRAHTIISGYILRPLSPDKTEVTLVVHMDLGGYLPASFINAIGGSAPMKMLYKIKSVVEKN